MLKSFITRRTLVNIHSTQISIRYIHTGAVCSTFWEPYRKGLKKYEPKPLTFKEKLHRLRNSWPLIKAECVKFKEEIIEESYLDPPIHRTGDSEYVYRFDDPDILQKFLVTSDKDHNEGSSECELFVNQYRRGVFKGNLSKIMPKDGNQIRTGYCNFSCKRPTKSFWRETFFEWLPYTHLILRVRGDGRCYMINLHCSGEYDIRWNDMYSYVLYTRGGPYWQIAKIPFSRFFLMSKGRIQDRQFEIPLNKITRFGITCADNSPGPFQLEIDYIALYFDPTRDETFAYELYQVPKFTAGH